MKKFNKALALLVAVLAVLSLSLFGGSALTVLGDINGDGSVKANDARTALRASAGFVELTAEQQLAADVNGDGKVKANDARLILRFAADLEKSFPHSLPASDNTSREPSTTKPTTTKPPISIPSTTKTPTTVPTTVPVEALEVGEVLKIEGNDASTAKVSQLKKYYIKGQVVDAMGTNDIEMARDGKNIFVKMKMTNKDVGVMIHKTSLNIINYESKEYFTFSAAIASSFGLSIEDLLADVDTDISIPSFDTFAGLNSAVVLHRGEVVTGYKLTHENGTFEQYFFKGNSQIPCCVEYFTAEGELDNALIIEKVDQNTKSYFTIPSNYKAIKIDILDLIGSMDRVMKFMEDLGMM